MIRLDAGLSGRDLARLMNCHSSKVSRIEHAKQIPSVHDIEQWCAHGRARDDAPDLVASMRAFEGMFVEWRRMERTGLRRAQEAVLPLWERTRRFRIYSSWVIPGPLQTRAYITALLSQLQDRRDIPDDIEAAVRVRVDKQRVLYEGEHSFAVILEEGALRHSIGGLSTMTAQLDHLSTLTALPSLSLGIVPLAADRSAGWPVESFFMFDNEQVSVELVSGHLTLTQPHEVRAHADVFMRFAEMAVYGTDARDLIARANAELDAATAKRAGD